MAQYPTDRPGENESFEQFFRRITSNNQHQGVQLKPSIYFQESFLYWYKPTTWAGLINQQRRKAQGQGVKLWSEWFKASAPMEIIISLENRVLFTNHFDRVRKSICPNKCRKFSTLYSTVWADWNFSEREAFTLTYVLEAPMFSSKTLLHFLSAMYQVSPRTLQQTTKIQILGHNEFVSAVRKVGWKGPVYFRGITAPDPKDANLNVVLIDGEFVAKKTNYSIPIFQALEYVGILIHELSHVMQAKEAKEMGIDLKIKSLEGHILLEGLAEIEAEKAMQEAATQEIKFSPLALYWPEQAYELIDKDTRNNSSAIPYKVGLALLATLKEKANDNQQLHFQVYGSIDGKISLEELLDSFFAP